MVRLKHRYLLLDILYPDPSTWPPPKIPTPTGPYSTQLAIHSPTSNALTPGLLAKMIREEVSEMYGDWGIGKLGGAAATGLNVKYLSPATSTAIIRCPRASFRLVWSALTYMSHVPAADERDAPVGTGQKRIGGAAWTRPCVFRVLRVSGTMRKAEEEAIRRARREIVRVRGLEEAGVLGDLVGSSGVVVDEDKKGGRRARANMETIMDGSEDEGMLIDEEEEDDEED